VKRSGSATAVHRQERFPRLGFVDADGRTGPAPSDGNATPMRTKPLLLILLLLTAAGETAAQGGPRVRVDAVRLERMERIETLLGRIVARRRGEVASRVSGPVARVPVRVGQRVERGQPLVRLDTVRLALEVELARAELATAESEVAEAARNLELRSQEKLRLERLEGSAAFSRARYEDKLKEVEIAASRLATARARLERARVVLRFREADLADATIRAPYAGVVTRKRVSPGKYVREGEPVIDMVDDADLEIEADIAAERLAGLTPGSEVELRIDGEPVRALLRAVVPIENPLTRTRAVRFAFLGEPPSSVTAVGQSVRVEVPVGGEEVVTVAKDAVTVVAGRQTVFVVEDGTVRRRAIETAGTLGDRFVVAAGLAPGEIVVVRGNERLRPGQKVTVENPAVTAAPAGEGAGG